MKIMVFNWLFVVQNFEIKSYQDSAAKKYELPTVDKKITRKC